MLLRRFLSVNKPRKLPSKKIMPISYKAINRFIYRYIYINMDYLKFGFMAVDDTYHFWFWINKIFVCDEQSRL